MLRIHFTARDLERVRIRPGPDLRWETALALYLLYGGAGADRGCDAWRARAARVLCERGLQQRFAVLRALVKVHPATAPADAVAGLPARLAEAPGAARLFHETLITPDWSRMTATVTADRACRMRRQADGGLVGLFDSLRPQVHWQAPVLEVRCPSTGEIRLDGRGLCLVPAFFRVGFPVTSADGERAPVLVYPVQRERPQDRNRAGIARHAALGRVLGHTRARVLDAVEYAPTTAELAKVLAVSQATVSEHAKALREAGLTARCRDRGRAVHTLTHLGAALLRGAIPPTLPHRA